MKHLKCLDNFINSKSNYYNEEQMQLSSISMLKERGVEIDDIAFLSYYAQCKYLPNLTLDECKKAVCKIRFAEYSGYGGNVTLCHCRYLFHQKNTA